MELTDRLWHLMAKALNNEASSQELEELHNSLNHNDSLRQQYELLNRIWQEKDDNTETEETARQVIQKIINRASTQPEEIEVAPVRRSRLRRRAIFASAFVILAVIATTWFLNSRSSYTLSDENLGQEQIIAKNGSRSRSLLPDGTTVWLNAGSTLNYENDFMGATREVTLEGEAFFDVVKNADRPFIVHTSGIDIKVLGTAFNVKSYPEDKTVETTLYRGHVKVFRENESEKTAIDLIPNQKLILPKEAATGTQDLSSEKTTDEKSAPTTFAIALIDSTKTESERFETAWLYSRLEFRGDNFEELAFKLERWYNVSISFTDERVKKLNFNGSFEKETVEQAFEALQAALPLFTYKIKNHEISVGSSR